MLPRYEYNIQTGMRTTINQIVYRNDEDETIVLDDGIAPPDGFKVYEGDLSEGGSSGE